MIFPENMREHQPFNDEGVCPSIRWVVKLTQKINKYSICWERTMLASPCMGFLENKATRDPAHPVT